MLLIEVSNAFHVYQEFHGMCGEAAECRNLTIVLLLSKLRKPGAMAIPLVLKHLKLFRYVMPDTGGVPCPHYAGPVLICATEAFLKDQQEYPLGDVFPTNTPNKSIAF